MILGMVTEGEDVFTGIIESFGTIKRIESAGEGKRLVIGCDLDLSESRIGDSIAVNGACLTAVTLGKNEFSVDMAPETVSRTTFSSARPGSRVNIERAMKLSSRVDGPLVSGHIDGTGTIGAIQRKSNAIIVTIQVGPELAADMIEKGSVAIEGISLTINRCSDSDFDVSIIPHTAAITTIGLKNVGDSVNIETDMLGKYVRKILTGKAPETQAAASSGVDTAFLAKNGFL